MRALVRCLQPDPSIFTDQISIEVQLVFVSDLSWVILDRFKIGNTASKVLTI
jgi:hypothetical protein